MKIISWNVNGIRATHKKGELFGVLDREDPDILFMQEIKATTDKLTDELLTPIPYIAHYNSAEKPGYAGTGVWIHSRVFAAYDIEFLTSFPDDPTANEGRVAHIQLKVKNEQGKMNNENTRNAKVTEFEIRNPQLSTPLDIFGIYFPNGGKSEQAWQDKLVFYKKFAEYMDTLRADGHMVLWGGDINCAHQAIDLARPKENDGKIGFHPLERAWLDNRTNTGWHDIWREKNPTEVDIYSWWDPVTRSRERNVGWRIDAWWGSDDVFVNVRDIGYLPNQMGSDHCPIYIEIL